MKKSEYNYSNFTLVLDKDDDEELVVIEWLHKRRTKKNGYSALIKTALKKYIKAEKKKLLPKRDIGAQT